MTTQRGIGPVPENLNNAELDQFLTQVRRVLIDAQSGRIASLIGGTTSTTTVVGGGGGGSGGGGTPYVPDLTPPPTPSGVVVTAGLDFVFIETDPPIFTQGNGYYRTLVYGATYSGTGPLPTFLDAVVVHEYVGQVGSFATPPGTQWHIWVKWITNDDVESTNPEGGANGHQVTTSLIGNSNLGPLIIEAGNLADGSVTATKVAAQAISLTKFANGIEPVGIVGALPNPSGYTGAKTTLLTTDGKLYRYVGGAWTRAVDGGDITANSITAGAIAAGAIGATQIAAGAITTGKLLVTGRGASLNDDPACRDASAWTTPGWGGAAVSFITNLTDGITSPTAMRSGATTSSADGAWSRGIPVSLTGKTYRISAYARRSATANGEFYLRYATVNGGGSLLAEYSVGIEAITLTESWVRYSALISSPAGNLIVPRIILNYLGNSGYMEAQDVRIEEAIGADLIVDGSILANKLAANSIAVGTAAIQNGAIVNAMLGNATITDAKIASVSATKLTAGTIAVGQYIQSSDFNSGVSGWRMGGNTAEIGSTYIRGQLTASQIDTRNLTIKNSDGQIVFSSGGAVVIDGFRATNPNPQDYQVGESFFFKDSSAIGLSSPSTYGSLRTLRTYGGGADLTGGPVIQWFEDTGLVWSRRSTSATTWGAWEAVPNGTITSSNVSTYIASAAIGDAQIGTLNASKIIAGSITTDKLQVGSVSAAGANSSSTSYGLISNVSSISRTNDNVVSLTTTGAPVTVQGLVDVYITLSGPSAASVALARVTWASLQRDTFAIDYAFLLGQSPGPAYIPLGVPVSGRTGSIRIPFLAREVLAAGAHNWGYKIDIQFLDVNGVAINTNCELVIGSKYVAQENKV